MSLALRFLFTSQGVTPQYAQSANKDCIIYVMSVPGDGDRKPKPRLSGLLKEWQWVLLKEKASRKYVAYEQDTLGITSQG